MAQNDCQNKNKRDMTMNSRNSRKRESSMGLIVLMPIMFLYLYVLIGWIKPLQGENFETEAQKLLEMQRAGVAAEERSNAVQIAQAKFHEEEADWLKKMQKDHFREHEQHIHQLANWYHSPEWEEAIDNAPFINPYD